MRVSYRVVWRPTREASGIDATPHDFRHSWVTNLSAAGIDVADLADIAGHSVELAAASLRAKVPGDPCVCPSAAG